jgi:3-oxoadipate enol-lactonase
MNVNVNGTTLHAEQAGVGPPLIFVHGMCGDSRVWAEQVGKLSDRFRCTTYDRRGHTRSRRTSATESVELHTEDLASLIVALDLAPALIVGSSGGARIALDLIRRHADLVRGAVLSEPPVGALAPNAFSAMVGAVAPTVQRALELAGPAAAVDAFFAEVCPGLWSRIDEETRDHYRDNAPMLFADLGMSPYEITADEIAEIAVPVLVVSGAHSHPALREAAANLRAWLPDARWLELDCGHVTYAERSSEFAVAVAGFAAQIGGAPAYPG